MSSWGGSRSGAGAPKRGVSHARRLLVDAIQRGLESAGRDKGLTGDRHEVATQAAAEIVRGMVNAGRGDEVLKLYAIATPVAEGAAEGARSPLLEALSKLPGMVEDEGEVPETSPDGERSEESVGESMASGHGATDVKSDGPRSDARQGVTLDAQGNVLDVAPGGLFDPAPMLIPPADFELAGRRGAYGRADRPATPHTPPGGDAQAYSLHGKNFDSAGGQG